MHKASLAKEQLHVTTVALRVWKLKLEVLSGRNLALQKLGNCCEKGLAQGGTGGLREEIAAALEIQTSFLCPFAYVTLRRRGTQFWGLIFALFGVLLLTNPLPPTLFQNL